MAFNQIRLELDPTGINPSNRIINEPYTLGTRPVRSIATKLGPYYANSLIIMDEGRELVRGTDFQCVELHQEATLKYGQEICSVVLIINSSISTTGSITYQALGGHYTYSDSAVSNMYQSVINDNRPVDWVLGLLNKPNEYPPSIHRHLLDDLYGFEPIVDYLERIKRAITLGQVDIVLSIVNALLAKFSCCELPKAIPSSKLVQYDALLYFLSRRKILNNIWVDKKECDWIKGNSQVVQVDTSGYPIGTTLYWEFYKPDMNVSLFTCKNGEIKCNGGIAEFSVYIPSDPSVTDYPLYIGIKEHPSDIDYKAVTYIIDIKENITTDSIYGHLLFNTEETNDFTVMMGDIVRNDELRLWYQFSTQ